MLCEKSTSIAEKLEAYVQANKQKGIIPSFNG